MRVQVDRGRDVDGETQRAVRREFEVRELREAAVAAVAEETERTLARALRLVATLAIERCAIDVGVLESRAAARHGPQRRERAERELCEATPIETGIAHHRLRCLPGSALVGSASSWIPWPLWIVIG